MRIKYKRISSLLIATTIFFCVNLNVSAVYSRSYIGVEKPGYTYYGIKADISTPNRLPTFSGNPAIAAWVSTVESGSTSSNVEWIQTGFRYNPTDGDTTYRTYVECKKDTWYYISLVGYQTLSTAINYRVNFTSYDNNWHAMISGVDKYRYAMDVQQKVEAETECIKLASTDSITLYPITFDNVNYYYSEGGFSLNNTPVTADSPYNYTVYNNYYKFSCQS